LAALYFYLDVSSWTLNSLRAASMPITDMTTFCPFKSNQALTHFNATTFWLLLVGHPQVKRRITHSHMNMKPQIAHMEQGPNAPPAPHVLVFPFPAQGHVNSMLKLAELLALAGLQVTFLNTDHNHDRLVCYTIVLACFTRFPEPN
jgi:hypothetical protein